MWVTERGSSAKLPPLTAWAPGVLQTIYPGTWDHLQLGLGLKELPTVISTPLAASVASKQTQSRQPTVHLFPLVGKIIILKHTKASNLPWMNKAGKTIKVLGHYDKRTNFSPFNVHHQHVLIKMNVHIWPPRNVHFKQTSPSRGSVFSGLWWDLEASSHLP